MSKHSVIVDAVRSANRLRLYERLRRAEGDTRETRLVAALFVVAWTGQFIGHAIEGKKPSFFEDLQFLMIGPLWLLGNLYRRLGLAY